MAYSKKKVNELIEGDVFSYKRKRYTFSFMVMRGNGKYDIYCHDYKELSLCPEDEVLYIGKCKDPSYWSDDEKRTYTKKMWSELRDKMPSYLADHLEKQYYADLFGKRGHYAERHRVFFTDNYKDVCNIKSILDDGDNVEDIIVSTYEDIDTSYSRQYETECYGQVALYVYIKTKKNEHYQLSQGIMRHISEEMYEQLVKRCCNN